MSPTTVYLETDDEITTAIGRLRALTDRDVIAVVPPGSKIATSRINFKLLAREAAERRMNLVAVSDEPQVRALAISAGLPAYDSISTAEKALTTFADQDKRLAERINRTMPREHPQTSPSGQRLEQTTVLPSVAARAAVADSSGGTAVHPAQQPVPAQKARQRRRPAIAPLLVLFLLLLLVAGVAYGAYVFLPTASVTLRPAALAVHPADFSVTADPNVAVVDETAGVIPAQVVTLPVHVGATFNATGVEAHDTKATGSVRFKSENTVTAVSIPSGTVVSTAGGVDFVTTDDVVVPKASFDTGPTQADVGVRAVKGGPTGNVDANTITVVPSDVKAAVVAVSNPDPTTGGKHTEDQVVSQTDYDTALTTLNGQLPAALQQTLANPQSVPRGLVAYPQTAQLSAGAPDQAAATLVGTVTATFDLAVDATADVTAVNETQIQQVAAARVRAALASGQKLVSDAVNVVHDAGTVTGDTVVYRVQANGLGYISPDQPALLAALRGKSLADARTALASFGDADISIWPEFVDRLPDQIGRISVTVVAPSPPPATAAPPTSGPATAIPTPIVPATPLPSRSATP